MRKKLDTKNHFMQKSFTKEEKIILTAFENGIFPLRKQYPSGMDDWKDDMD